MKCAYNTSCGLPYVSLIATKKGRCDSAAVCDKMYLLVCGSYLTKPAILEPNSFAHDLCITWNNHFTHIKAHTFSTAQAYGSIIKYKVHKKPVKKICLGPLMVGMTHIILFFYDCFLFIIAEFATLSWMIFDTFHSGLAMLEEYKPVQFIKYAEILDFFFLTNNSTRSCDKNQLKTYECTRGT